MGESSSRRSTLVSRLPIFRRSSSKKQDSLPSSPSSGGVGNGVHTSSPSSTNSSSGSTGKRRSLFRAPSLGFSSKRNSDPREPPANLNLSSPPPPQVPDANGNSQSAIPTSVSAGFSEGGGRSKSRHSFGFGSHRQKKITRSQTEDFDKASSSSSSTGNRNVFINCISGSGVNEGDDSGFLDDFSGASNNNKRSSSRQKKQLLPKSFSAHHRFSSRNSDHHRPPEVTVEACPDAPTPTSTTVTPGSWPGELLGAGGESSLQSPMISEDRTTAITPSEFHPITEDSASDSVDALPAPSPVPAVPPESATVPEEDVDAATLDATEEPENNNTAASTSQVFFSPAQSSAERPLPPDTSTANNTDYETAVSLSEPETAVPCPPLREQSAEERQEREEERKGAREEVSVEERRELTRGRRAGYNTETSESEPYAVRSEGAGPERRPRTTRSFQEPRGSFCGCHEPRHSHLRKPHAGSLCSSVSPYHEVMRLERRLRSSSEGAGGPHIHGNVPGLEGCGLLKHRHNSSSSKLGSLDVLNNLGSSELDEDDLMLDLDLSDDQKHRHVSRENSSQSLTSCLLHSPLDPNGERILGKEFSHRESNRPISLLLAEGSSGLAVGREDEPPAPGLETLPLRLMQQDCTAVKTLLLRLKRTLQESTETSPASSLQSLPISPCSEKSLPFKDPGREEALLQQLKEKDELIVKLQNELESAKAALKMKDCQMTDRTTQTEHAGPETNHPGRWSGAGSNSSSSLGSRERRAVRPTAGAAHAGDHINQHAPHHPLHGRAHTARDEQRHHQAASTRSHGGNVAVLSVATYPLSQHYVSNHSRQLEAVSSSVESLTQSVGGGGALSLCGGLRRGEHHPHHHPSSHIPRAINSNGSSASSSLHSLSRASVSSSDQSSPPPATPSSVSSVSSSSSAFAGRLGQPPRGPLSLHSYTRKNVFLQHSLHTAELQALTQRDS
uniref:Coiled-coil serine-rich protein 1 n=1 Tax=Neogobius melanostomus TaxID=47308 RepID=A0A8C6SWM1_9GOBI